MKNNLVAYPLNEFYAMAEMPLPAIEAVSGEQVPEPQKTLLVHENDMTPTLQKFYNYRIDLELKKKVLNGRFFMREVVLLERRRRPVVFGAIRIHLEMFPEAVRQKILECRRPLGEILSDHQIPHRSHPDAFFRMVPDEIIKDALQLHDDRALYGRVNRLLDPQGEPLVEVVEILPPGA